LPDECETVSCNNGVCIRTHLHHAVPAHLVLVSTERTDVVVSLQVGADVVPRRVDERRGVGDEVLEQHGTERRHSCADDRRPQQPVVGVAWVVMPKQREPATHRLASVTVRTLNE